MVGGGAGLGGAMFLALVTGSIAITTPANFIENMSDHIIIKIAAKVVQLIPCSFLIASSMGFSHSLRSYNILPFSTSYRIITEGGPIVSICFPLLTAVLTHVAQCNGFPKTAACIYGVEKLQLLSAKIFNLYLSYLGASIILTASPLALPSLIGVVALVVNSVLFAKDCYKGAIALKNCCLI